ncbi:hypothetical protein [Pedobacter sp. P26]|uniref:hypothetical protein n=1 Tax=Pedobacter sp. P26 TaxID=3423956 RepID=UPI003D6771B0
MRKFILVFRLTLLYGFRGNNMIMNSAHLNLALTILKISQLHNFRCHLSTFSSWSELPTFGIIPVLDGEITPAEHRKVKEEVGSTVVSLESHLRSLNVQKSTPNQVKNLAEKAVRLLCELDKLFEICNIEAKRLLIGTFFPRKVDFF